MSEDRVRPLDHVVAGSELEAGDGGHGPQHGTAQRRDRIGSSERCGHFAWLRVEGPGSQPRLAKSAAPEGGHAPESSPRSCALPERQTLAKPDSQPAGTRPATQ